MKTSRIQLRLNKPKVLTPEQFAANMVQDNAKEDPKSYEGLSRKQRRKLQRNEVKAFVKAVENNRSEMKNVPL